MRVQAVLPPKLAKPVKRWVYDESRFGLHTIRRRRITARGTKPVRQVQHRFENCYLYGAIAPDDGDGFFLGLPTLNADQVQIFLEELAKARPDTFNILLVDNSRCHTANALEIPADMALVFQEPYAPELNPAERVWQDLKTALAWQRFTTLAELQAELVRLVEAYDAATLQSLTAYPYIIAAINAVCA